MAYIGRGVDKLSNIEKLDVITFDGSQSYTLQKGGVNFTPSSANNLQVSIDGVVQAGNFTVSGSTIDFGVAVAGTSTNDFIFHYGTGLITTPADGTVSLAKLSATGTKDSTTFLRGDNTFATPSGGKVLQAVSSSYTGAVESTTSNTFQPSSLFVNITPSATSSKILVLACGNAGTSGTATSNRITLYRDSTNLGDSTHGINQVYSSGGSVHAPFNINLLDSPSTTSQITYKIYWKAFSGAHAQYLHTDGLDSFITALEIGA